MLSSNPREDFAPFWLAMTILNDPASSKEIEKFLKTTYDGCGALFIHNRRTGSMYEDSADRYAATVVYLASIWSRDDKYTMSLHRGNKIVDTSILDQMEKPDTFKEALSIGEEAYRNQRTYSRQPYLSFVESAEPLGNYKQVWVPSGYKVQLTSDDDY